MRAQDRADEPTISALPLPGGLAALRKAVNDPGRTLPGQFYVDVIRRSFQTPVAVRGTRREVALRPILDHLDRAAKASAAHSTDGIPLPLAPDLWLEVAARARCTQRDARRRHPAFIVRIFDHCGLLSLDEETRRWFGRIANCSRRSPRASPRTS